MDGNEEAKEIAEEIGDKVADEIEDVIKEVKDDAENAAEETPAETVVVDTGTVAIAIQTGVNAAEIAAVKDELEEREESDEWLRNEVKDLREWNRSLTEQVETLRTDLLTLRSPPELPPQTTAEIPATEVEPQPANTDGEKTEHLLESVVVNPVAELGEAVAEVLAKPAITFL